MRVLIFFTFSLFLFVNANICGDGVCQVNENCFADCAGSKRKFVCPSGKCLLHILLECRANGTVGNSIVDGAAWAAPGMDHINRGFDIVYGQEKLHPILALLYCDDDPDPESRISYLYRNSLLLVPQSVHLTTAPKCSYSSQASVFSYASSFAQSKAHSSSMSVSVSAHAISTSASYSKDSSVQTAVAMTSKSDRKIVVVESKCITSTFEWREKLDQEFGATHLHPDFENDLNKMKTVSDAVELVEKYGSHFYKSANLGGKMEQISTVDSSFASSKSEQALAQASSKSFSASVSGGIGSFSAGVSTSYDSSSASSSNTVNEKEQSQSFESNNIITNGGAPFAGGDTDWSSWATTIDTLPVPVEYTLEEILTIIPNVYNKYNVSIREMWNEGVYLYLLSNQYTWRNAYQITTSSSCTDDDFVYGPYAFQIISAAETEPIMEFPQLFRQEFSGDSYFFISNSIDTFGITIFDDIQSPIERIEFISIEQYINGVSTVPLNFSSYLERKTCEFSFTQLSVQDKERYDQELLELKAYCRRGLNMIKPKCRTGITGIPLPTNFTPLCDESFQTANSKDSVLSWPLESISLLNVAQGTESLYYPDRTGITLTASAVDRTFYEITITTVTPEANSTLEQCKPSSSFDSGILELGIYGSKEILLDSCTSIESTSVYNNFRIASQEDIGILTHVVVKAAFTYNSFCLSILNIKVVDLDGRVYNAPFVEPRKFALTQVPLKTNTRDSIRKLNNKDKFSAAAYKNPSAVLLGVLTPLSPATSAKLIYLYQLGLVNGTIDSIHQAKVMCNKVGGVLSSQYHLQKALEHETSNWCSPGIAQDSVDPTMCYIVRSTYNATCAGGTGVMQVNSTNCGAMCVGPLPSSSMISFHNYTLRESPIVLMASFVSLLPEVNVTNIQPSSNTTTTPVSNNNCNASVILTQQNTWIDNGSTVGQYGISFYNTGNLVVTSLYININSNGINNIWGFQPSGSSYKADLPNGIFIGGTISGSHGMLAKGNAVSISLASVECN